MGRRKKVPYNHASKDVFEAAGINREESMKKFENFLDTLNEEQPDRTSLIAEKVEATFGKRELSVLLANDIANTCQCEPSLPANPLELLAALALVSGAVQEV